MEKLPENFALNRYGLKVRFVDVKDAEFIRDIRIDKRNQRYIHDTSNDLQDQIDYIKKYKLKESTGEEYYFLFEYNNEPQGVYRIYNRHEDWCTTGSWVFSHKANKYSAIKALIITHEIVFEELRCSLMKDVDGTNENNRGVIYMFSLLGATFGIDRLDAKGRYITFMLDKDSFIKNKNNILRLIGF